tara:strand:- start:396 stop:827 length:432 start_codon:yes stop_codon:yes gene_type:complete
MKNLGNFVIFSFAFLLSHIIYGHHAFTAEFDANAPINITGKVVKVEWINPHAWVHVEVKEDSKETIWMVEGGTPNTLIRNGLTKNSIKPGTVINVRGYQSKGKLCLPRCIANGRDITFPDGRKVFMGSSGTGAPRDGSDPRER